MRIPKVGRFRLFQRADPGHVVCRVCRARMREGNMDDHDLLEFAQFHAPGSSATCCRDAERALEARLEWLLRVRRSRRNLRRSRWEYKVGRGADP